MTAYPISSMGEGGETIEVLGCTVEVDASFFFFLLVSRIGGSSEDGGCFKMQSMTPVPSSTDKTLSYSNVYLMGWVVPEYNVRFSYTCIPMTRPKISTERQGTRPSQKKSISTTNNIRECECWSHRRCFTITWLKTRPMGQYDYLYVLRLSWRERPLRNTEQLLLSSVSTSKSPEETYTLLWYKLVQTVTICAWR